MLGYALITCGIYTFEMVKSGDANYNDEYDYIGLMLVGSFIACLFWVSSATVYVSVVTCIIVYYTLCQY